MINLKEHKFTKNSFIGGWYIPKNICENIIKFFHLNKNLQGNGVVYDVKNKSTIIDTNVKQSIEVPIDIHLYEGCIKDYRDYLQICLDNYVNKYPILKTLDRFNINQVYNLQYYPKGGGYKTWHCERGTTLRAKRVLVFMTYLNNVSDGGTDFEFQKITSPAKQGLTLIWPSEWTHTHKSQISKTKEKYIMTGWYSFN